MALAVWPPSLSYRPVRPALEVQQRFAPPIATEVEDGPARLRSASTAVWSKHAYQLRFLNADYPAFDDFVVITLARGTARFMMPVGRPYTPDPWPQKLVYIESGTLKAKPDLPTRMLVSFTLNVLDW